MSDLHAKIMNIQCIKPGWCRSDEAIAYRLGHRDARHAAAELAAMEAARIEDLTAALEKADALATQLDGRNVWMEKVHAAAHDYRTAREATK